MSCPGCRWIPSQFAILTVLLLNSATIAENFKVELGEPALVPDAKPGVPVYQWSPDGHIAVLPVQDGMQVFWSGASTYRTVGPSFDQMRLSPVAPLITKGEAVTDFDNGGAWLYSVVALSKSEYLGFYHAEDHEWINGRSRRGIAWKSIALCTSADGGETWTKKGQILTSAREKPEVPTWGGCGDHCVVYDKIHSRWCCFFQEHFICMAVSDDRHASPGTWRKWYKGWFDEPGLAGKLSRIEGLESHPGGNPSVHYNNHLQCWFMVWHTWRGSLVYSWSRDLVRWEHPVELLTAVLDEKVWYPTIVGVSDTVAGQEAVLYYGLWPDKKKRARQFLRRSIRFVRD